LERVPLARRAARLSASLAAADHGDAIPFDSGHGFPRIFPDLTEAAEIALTRYRAETLQYAPRSGIREMREWIASYMAEEGARVGADDVLVVNGAKHGLELVCRALLDPGDAIVVTAPMYFTAIPLFRSFEPQFIEIGQDEEGLDTDELAEALARWRHEGRPAPKFIYNVPEFHNPTGLTMSRRRREALLDIARRYGTWVVEDSPYRAIRFEGTADPTLLALDRSASVIHVGTFSKLLAPGTGGLGGRAAGNPRPHDPAEGGWRLVAAPAAHRPRVAEVGWTSASWRACTGDVPLSSRPHARSAQTRDAGG
jgi:2-aminoadipate transaminase